MEESGGGGGGNREMHFSRDDAVERIGNPSTIGIILSVGGDSENDSSSDDSDDESVSSVEEGCARVWWINAEETTEQLGLLRVVDRPFHLSHIVALSSDPLGQTGSVAGVETFVDLEYPNGEVVKDVNTRQLRRIRSFLVGDYVMRDYWIGRVEEVVESVTILFDDGAKCKLGRVDPSRLVPLGVRRPTSLDDDGVDCPYYPGQRVRAGSSLLFDGAKWLRGSWKPSRMEGVVAHVDTRSVMVYWINAGHAAANQPVPPIPSEHQDTRNLIKLTDLSHMGWVVGDRSLPPRLPTPERNSAEVPRNQSDGEASEDNEPSGPPGNVNVESVGPSASETTRSTEQPQENSPAHFRKHRRCTLKREKKKSRRRHELFEAAVLVIRTRTNVDVVWQDGSKSSGLPASSLIQVRYLGDNDFWPEHHVIERSVEGEDGGHRRTGIVKSVNAQERTAKVKWFKRRDSYEEPGQFENEETVSVYEILEHPDYSYCLGDIVIRLAPVVKPSDDSTASSSTGTMVIDEEYYRKPDRKKKPEPVQGISWAGTVVGLEDGRIDVRWCNDQVSQVGPEEIFVVNRDEDEDEDEDSEYDSEDAASWETASDTQETDRERGNNRVASDGNNASSAEGGLSLSAAFSMISKLAVTWVRRAKKAAVGGRSLGSDGSSSSFRECSEESAAEMEVETGPDTRVPEMIEDMINLVLSEVPEEAPASVPVEAISTGAPPAAAETFKHFDVVKDASDHHYVCEENKVNERRWLKKVQQEWNILKNNLPETIYVRIYEDRMDLMRAVIVGAAGTPYHDGLFVFDICLPSDYPTVPPVVYYRSGGLRLNPNLYESGKVCLSLLNTWSGKGTELWNPGTSNILQVLVSIQGLVLNAKPYFNEAGYEKQTGTGEGEKNSIAYNENAFLLSCKSMIYLIRRPPMHFEEFVKNHFRSRGEKFLACCKAYLDGVPVGYLSEDGKRPVDSNFQGSAGFKLLLSKLFPKLEEEFKSLRV